jgi:predicted GIY-YIG superfamily endonuclease/3-methyladenine DNA glycosylase AlkD
MEALQVDTQAAAERRLTHYMYVLCCADGSFYAGYAVDVAAREAAHNAGRTGAKCTRGRLPVRVVACARFYTKHQAMRAEWAFKQLTRPAKMRVLALAGAGVDAALGTAHAAGATDATPPSTLAFAKNAEGVTSSPLAPDAANNFREILYAHVPQMQAETAHEFVARSLFSQVDPAYATFERKLIPSVDPTRILGVRTPALKRIARALAARPDAQTFFDTPAHATFEETQVHAFAIARIKPFDQMLAAYKAFLPQITNWATSDQLPTAPLLRQPARARECALEWLQSPLPYTQRVGILVLMKHFLGPQFEPAFMQAVANVSLAGPPERPNSAYYVGMARAWYFAEACAQRPQDALAYLQKDAGLLDEFTRRAAIQKAIESRRVTPEVKSALRTLR